ncbi:NERD domain-containing protein [Ammoniphilus sp. YIM 78166]|uniref:NERD domain-containing protein n=1 Tax=Ammoniphilus sp. YIM 78166 TaxID=1644106 RepID=UPI00106F2928|nr:NERD domain-containing protein [Ammoniphilus sp. YIM 78166]
MTLYFIILIAFSIFSFILRSPKVKGYIGEKKVQKKLKSLDPNQYISVHDIMIQISEGKTSQIDHIILSSYGIFVIETKNYQGWIFGKDQQQYWTQTIYKRKEKLFNPVWQNKGHIKALQDLLSDFPTVPYHSIIVFGDQATLKVESNTHVIYASQLVSTILKYQQVVLNQQDIHTIQQRILRADQTDRKMRKEHVTSIHQNMKVKTLKVAELICPRCEGELVERTGKYGIFHGCSNYPKCRYVVKERKVVGIGSYKRK